METPSPNNPLGMKGAGEGGIVAAIPAVLNAVDDALSPYGIRVTVAPVTPERLWKNQRSVRKEDAHNA